MRFAVAFVVAVCVACVSAQCASQPYISPDGVWSYNLQQIDALGPFQTTGNGGGTTGSTTAPSVTYNYQVSICTPLNCQSMTNPNITSPAGCQTYTNKANQPQTRVLGQINFMDVIFTANGPEVNYDSGDQCGARHGSVNRTMIVTLVCGSQPSPVLSFLGEPAPCIYQFQLSGAQICPTAVGSQSGGVAGFVKKLSAGSIILIIGFVLFIVYFIFGCAYKRIVTGATGAEMIPNIDFWRAFPGLVADGFGFVCGRKSSPSYDQI